MKRVKSKSSRISSAQIQHKRRGGAMVMATVFVTITAMVVAYGLLASNRQMRNTHRSVLFDTTLAAASTMANSMIQQAYYIATTRPTQMEGNFNKMDEVIKSIKPSSIPGYITAKSSSGKDLTFFASTTANPGVWETINDPKDDWNGFNIRRWSYDAVAFLNERNETTNDIGNVAKRLGFEGAGFKSRITINFIPLYQYAIFYDKDLEFHPGPVMNVNGPVHTNSTLWLASGGGLNLKDKVSAAGKLRTYRDFIDVSNTGLQVNIKLKNGNKWDPEGDGGTGYKDHAADVSAKNKNGTMASLNKSLPSGYDTNGNGFTDSGDRNWLTDALSRFGGNVTDVAMGNKPIRPPLPFVGSGSERKQADPGELIQRLDSSNPSNDPYRAVKMEAMADIVIEGDPSQTEIKQGTNEVVFKPGAVKIRTVNKDSDGLFVGFGPEIPITDKNGKNAIVKPGSFQDYRENKKIKTIDIDMAALNARTDVTASYITNGNGVIYASTDASKDTSSQMGAVRITNASRMPRNSKNAMTVATDRPMYLAGNVNTDSKATLLLAGDAMTVLSKELNDSTGRNSGSAGDTETNAIFMLGQVSSKYTPVDPTTKKPVAGVQVDSYGVPNRGQNSEKDHYEPGYGRFQWSGGVHNVIRYLENWGGKKHTYNGSLICLFESRVATSRHQTTAKGYGGDSTYYGAPDRNYNWDASLKDKEPPKGMPVLVEVKVSPLERISKAEAVALLR